MNQRPAASVVQHPSDLLPQPATQRIFVGTLMPGLKNVDLRQRHRAGVYQQIRQIASSHLCHNAEEEAAGLTAVVPYLLQDALTEKGASYVEGPLFESHVVQDGRLITGQNPQSAAELGRVLVQALQSL